MYNFSVVTVQVIVSRYCQWVPAVCCQFSGKFGQNLWDGCVLLHS